MTKKDEYNQKQIDSGAFTGAHLTRVAEFWQDGHFLKTDGLCGPNTLKSILGDEMIDIVSDADTEPTRQVWEPFYGPLAALPTNRRDVYKILGNPANGAKVDRKWVKENIREYRDLPGVPPKWYVKLNKLAEPYVREALRRAAEVSDYKITRFGGFVFRRIRNKGIGAPLSYHSWGIAFDVNPRQNLAQRYAKGSAPEPFSEEWREVWPDGMGKAFADAIKSVGFSWGGDWSTFKDPMHFELVL